MTDQHHRTTPAALRAEAEDIILDAHALIDALDLYEAVYADEISEEVSRLSGRIGVKGHTIRRAHLRAHARDAAFVDEVNQTLDQLDAQPLSLLQETREAEDRQGVWWDPRPDLHTDIDAWSADWTEGDEK